MNELSPFNKNLQAWPLWSQILLTVILLIVTHFWVNKLISSVRKTLPAATASNRIIPFLLYAMTAMGLSWLAVSFCVGKNTVGKPYEWGFYGRTLFIGLWAYLTNLLTRYFAS